MQHVAFVTHTDLKVGAGSISLCHISFSEASQSLMACDKEKVKPFESRRGKDDDDDSVFQEFGDGLSCPAGGTGMTAHLWVLLKNDLHLQFRLRVAFSFFLKELLLPLEGKVCQS